MKTRSTALCLRRLVSPWLLSSISTLAIYVARTSPSPRKAAATTDAATAADAAATADAAAPAELPPPPPQQQASDASSDGDSSGNDNGSAGKNSHASSLRRVQKTARALADILKPLKIDDARRLALEIVRETTKALSTQETKPTGYQLFIKMNSGRYRKDLETAEETAGLTKSQHTQLVFRKIAETWRSLSEDEKKHYNNLVAAPREVTVSA